MSVNLMADRYAGAFCELARQWDRLEELLEVLEGLQGVFEPAMAPIFENPNVSKDEERALVKETLSGRVPDLVRDFCLLLVEKGRFEYFDAIVEACKRRTDRLLNRKRAEVRSAYPLESSRKQQLRQRLGERFDAEIIINEVEDPDLLAGLRVRIDDYLMDNSISHQLERLHRRFRMDAN